MAAFDLTKICRRCSKPFHSRQSRAIYCSVSCGSRTAEVPAEIRFRAKVAIRGADECWEWQGYRSTRGYGSFWIRGRMRPAHRIAWELEHGPIPEGLSVLHRCDNPPCVNASAHLFLGTCADNVADKMAKGRHRSLFGETNQSSKLIERDVLEILSATESAGEIARRFGITLQNVRRIRNRQTWKYLGLEPAPKLPDGRTIPQNYGHLDRSAIGREVVRRQRETLALRKAEV